MFVKICWVLTTIATIVSVFVLFGGMAEANGAPQEAVAAAFAGAIVIIPYVFTRAMENLFKP